MQKIDNLIVRKYGGASLATIEQIKQVADDVINLKRKGNKVVVVVSARGNTTDDLLKIAHEITQEPDKRELDMLLATGELQSSALLALAIKASGENVVSLTGGQAGIITDGNFTNARIIKIDPVNIIKALQEKNIVIVAGYQGVDIHHNVTTLGRGGSDLTAVVLAAVLKAKRCELFKDVDGVYTADPKMIKTAKLIKEISYDEIMEMANLGAQIINVRAINYAKQKKVPLYIYSSMKKSKGTKIVDNVTKEKPVIRSIVTNENEIEITIFGIPDEIRIISKIFNLLYNIKLDLIVQNFGSVEPGKLGIPPSRAVGYGTVNITFTTEKRNKKNVLSTLEKIKKDISYFGGILVNEKIVSVSIIGSGLMHHPEVISSIFSILAKNKIPIHLFATSDIKITFIIDEKYKRKAVYNLHKLC
jgi:aspartate kinase